MEACQERWTALSQEHFGTAELGDKRRTKRLVKTAELMMHNPSGTLPKKLSSWADLMGLYRLVDCEKVTHQAVIKPHCRRTLEQMRQTREVVLAIQDSTELKYTTHTQLKNLGQIGTGHDRGYICHNILAVTPQRRVLGLVGQILHKRRKVNPKETPSQKRQHPDRESRLWLKGCEATGSAPQGCTWVDVCDRGSDTFEFLEYEHRNARKYVIRSARDRNLDGEDHVGDDRIHEKLHDYARGLATLGTRQVQTQARSGGSHPTKARLANVRVAAGPVSLAAPDFARGECSATSLDLWVVHVREIDPPAGVEPLEWVLLTNVETHTFAQACERVNWYECRWVIEDYHKAKKTGMGIELPQFEDEQRLEPVIGLLSVIAAVLLGLRQEARQSDADLTPATTIVPLLYVQVLSGRLYKQVRDDLSIREFFMGMARLGGHLGRKGDGFPGWLTLWRGWECLHHMVAGAEAIRMNEGRCV